jgi:hypothetical protein
MWRWDRRLHPAPLKKSGKGRNWDEDQHPRWPGGSGSGLGGRFAPAGAGSGALDQHLALSGVLIDKRYDEVIGITHCTYSTPLDTFTIDIKVITNATLHGR